MVPNLLQTSAVLRLTQIEITLAINNIDENKDALKDPSIATALGEILDLFVRAGWPDALRLTFKLDQAMR